MDFRFYGKLAFVARWFFLSLNTGLWGGGRLRCGCGQTTLGVKCYGRMI